VPILTFGALLGKYEEQTWALPASRLSTPQ
jgi:hypothetical protein